MQINWKLRFQNKTTLVALITLIVTFIYQLLGLFGVVPSISQDSITNFLMIVVNLLSALGVVVDPTTSGVSDSTNAMTYDSPKVSE